MEGIGKGTESQSRANSCRETLKPVGDVCDYVLDDRLGEVLTAFCYCMIMGTFSFLDCAV